MKIEIKIDSSCAEPKIIVMTDEITDEINDLVKRLSLETPKMLAGFNDGSLTLLEQQDIVRIFSESGKIIAKTEKGDYLLRLRLYELEERLDKKCFVRISNSEIINLKKVKRFDLSFAGTICVELTDKTVTYVSRRYVSKIKQLLGI